MTEHPNLEFAKNLAFELADQVVARNQRQFCLGVIREYVATSVQEPIKMLGPEEQLSLSELGEGAIFRIKTIKKDDSVIYNWYITGKADKGGQLPLYSVMPGPATMDEETLVADETFPILGKTLSLVLNRPFADKFAVSAANHVVRGNPKNPMSRMRPAERVDLMALGTRSRVPRSSKAGHGSRKLALAEAG